MTNNIDVETLLKHYTEGRISKQEFLHLHSLITQHQQAVPQTSLQNYLPVVTPAELDPKNHGVFHFVKTYLKSIVAFTGSLSILSTLAINYYHNFSAPPPRHEPEPVQVTQADSLSNGEPLIKKDISTVAESLMNDPIWDARSVNQFTSQWIAMSVSEKGFAKTDKWYSRFIETLKKQVKFELARRNDGENYDETENRHRALMHLATTLELISMKNPPNSLLELDEFLSSSPSVTASASARYSKQAHITEKKSDPAPEAAAAAQASKVAALGNADSAITRKVDNIIQGKEDIDVGRPDTSVGSPDIVKVMNQFAAAYRSGNRQQLVSLFADDKVLHRPLTLSAIQTQYNSLFQHSDQRRVEFRGLVWEQLDQETRGRGEFHTSLRVLPNGELKTITTNVLLAMRKIDDVTRITDFELTDNSLFSLVQPAAGMAPGTAGVNKAPAFDQLTPPSRHPTSTELKDIVTQYVQSYQQGDIDRIMKLFASSNWTTAPEGLIELRRDYNDLFNSTLDRQVTITNMDWSFKGDKAMGTGDLVINLQSRANHKITRKKGKVRMIVVKHQKPLISAFFQIMK